MSSAENENDSDLDYSETEECSYEDYYNPCDDNDSETMNQCDPEHFDFECLTVDQASYQLKAHSILNSFD